MADPRFKQLFEIKFSPIEPLIKFSLEREELLRQNIQTALVITVLYGITMISNECPVDTNRLRASIVGEFAGQAGVPMMGTPEETEGRALSVTSIDMKKMRGVIGTNVEYALYVEYGHKTSGPRKLTQKQIAYLIATGALVPDGRGGLTSTNIHKRINRKAGIESRVKGKGFFRKNIPLIQKELNYNMNEAIIATSEGRLLKVEGF